MRCIMWTLAQCIEMLKNDTCRAFAFAPHEMLAQALELDGFEIWLLCMRLDGASKYEIARLVGVTPQHISRRMAYAAQKLQHPRRRRVFGSIIASRKYRRVDAQNQ